MPFSTCDAIEATFNAICHKAKYALDADIAKCFDRIDHQALLAKLRTFPAMRRAIRAWLKAGVLDGKEIFPTTKGTPQGGIASPLLANIALSRSPKVLGTFCFDLRMSFGNSRQPTLTFSSSLN